MRYSLRTFSAIVLPVPGYSQPAATQFPEGSRLADVQSDLAGTRYSPLTQIHSGKRKQVPKGGNYAFESEGQNQ